MEPTHIPIQPVRDAEEYGDVSLSLQAGRYLYSDPREDGHPIEFYSSVEVGILGPEGLCRPSSVGIEGFDHLFEDGRYPVAGYVSQADVQALRVALKERMEAQNG